MSMYKSMTDDLSQLAYMLYPVGYPSSMKEPPISNNPKDIMNRVPKRGSWRKEGEREMEGNGGGGGGGGEVNTYSIQFI